MFITEVYFISNMQAVSALQKNTSLRVTICVYDLALLYDDGYA